MDCYDLKGKKQGTVQMPEGVFTAKENPSLISQAVRVYLANQRTGTRDSKTRTEVIGSTKKIYRQKGTGRARHGDMKAPIFIGGGIAHGPKPKDFSLHLTKKMKRKSLISALSTKFATGKIRIVESFSTLPPKTKELINVMKYLQLNLTGNKDRMGKIMIIPAKTEKNIFLAGRNISNLTLCPVSLLTTYEVLVSDFLVFEKEAIGQLGRIFSTEKNHGQKNDTSLSEKTEKTVKVSKKRIKLKKITVSPEKKITKTGKTRSRKERK